MHTMRLEAARLQAILEGELMSGSADVRRTARAGPNNCASRFSRGKLLLSFTISRRPRQWFRLAGRLQ